MCYSFDAVAVGSDGLMRPVCYSLSLTLTVSPNCATAPVRSLMICCCVSASTFERLQTPLHRGSSWMRTSSSFFIIFSFRCRALLHLSLHAKELSLHSEVSMSHQQQRSMDLLAPLHLPERLRILMLVKVFVIALISTRLFIGSNSVNSNIAAA
ncbi:hypothetical protein EXN66_Car008900 [Channa argus]|uniref:Uncharacterized protein n=1 Tax=Channa argus TaxID=215402 RepID=A0A6G1PSW0_CHAAH|nr:hypothetical protein EXN66_Car008900 [Channa argus]